MNVTIKLAVGAAMLFFASVAAAELPREDPGTLGLSAERLAMLDTHLQRRIDAGDFPGAITMVVRGGKIAHLSALGLRAEGGEPMSEDTLFRIYSMTKPIVSVAAMMLVEEGKISLSRPVHAYLPEFKEMTVAIGKADDGTIQTEPAKRAMTVHDLLRHTSGLTYGTFGTGPAREAMNEHGVASGDFDNRELAKLLASLPLEHHPGEVWEYSRATDVLGALIEVVDGKSLGEALHERIFLPLGMKDTAFWVKAPTDYERIAEPKSDDRMIGPVAMFDARGLRKLESGGGGLVSTIHDYARFLQMLSNRGELEGVRILSPHTVAYMTADHLGTIIKAGKYYLPGTGYGFGLGFSVRKETGLSPVMGGSGEFGWGGAGGTYFVGNPKQELFFVYMMQSPKHRSSIWSLLRNVIYGAITADY